MPLFVRTLHCKRRVFLVVAIVVLLCVSVVGQSSHESARKASNPCGACHSEIAKSYSRTVMAHASGPVSDGIVQGEFTHKPSGVHYKVSVKDGKAWMEFGRPDDPEVLGNRELLYYIGSGRKGASFLFETKGFWFETPINWYSQEGRWNMAPAYTEVKQIPMTLPALPECLDCHTSGMRAPAKGTENKYPVPPFADGGITCARCHGDGEAHGNGKGPIVNPAKLSPERRDEVCMQCHFEGSVAIEQPGKHLYEFKPGEKLSDYIHYFLLSEPASQKMEAVSQFEALWSSVCKQKSGDRMTCTSCHDPHSEPDATEKAAYYRGKCLSCHGQAFGKKHHPERMDCTGCHMPQLTSAAVAHTEATDHRILRQPNGVSLQSPGSEQKLSAFPAYVDTSTRDLALAWETLAQRRVVGAPAMAERYIKDAVSKDENDAVLLASAGYLQQERGDREQAATLYEKALKVDPLLIDAAANLGTLKAREGKLGEAVPLWQQAFQRAPYRSVIGMNLARAFCAAGQTKEARDYVLQVLEFNPDLPEAKKILKGLNGDPPRCSR
jgi:tetratricopeptide (TPR) repeat protein